MNGINCLRQLAITRRKMCEIFKDQTEANIQKLAVLFCTDNPEIELREILYDSVSCSNYEIENFARQWVLDVGCERICDP